MIGIYNKYILKSLIWPFLVIMFSLTGIIWLSQTLRYFDLIVYRGISVGSFFHLCSLLLPSLLLIILPISLFCAVIFVYNRFIVDCEIIVLKSSGFNRLALAKPAIFVSLLVGLFGLLNSFFIIPESYRNFKDMQLYLKNNYISILLQEGVFSSPTDGLTVFINSKLKNDKISGIFISDKRDNKKSIIITAKEGVLEKTANGPRFYLSDGKRQEIELNSNKLSNLTFDSYQMDIDIFTGSSQNRELSPDELYLTQLFTMNPSNEAKQKKYLAEAHNRLSWPLHSVTLSFIALSFILAGQFKRRGHIRRNLIAAVAGICYIAGYLLIKNSALTYSNLYAVNYIYAVAVILLCFASFYSFYVSAYLQNVFLKIKNIFKTI